MPKQATYKFNRLIDSFILETNDLHLSKAYGLRVLSEYLRDVELVSTGEKSVFELKYSQRRKEQSARFLASDNQVLSEFKTEADIPEGSIGHLQLSGMMRLSGGMSSSGIKSLARDIRRMAAHPNIKATVLEVDSGGGYSLAGQELKNAVRDSQNAGTPIYVYGHFVGSAALHGVLPAEKIFLSGLSSEIGSIGSYITISKRFARWYQDNYEDIYAKGSPQKNKEFREYLKGNLGPLAESVTRNAERFQSEVELYRNLNRDLAKDTLEGAMFEATEGIRRGLADGIKTLGEVYQIAFNHSNSNNMNFQEGYQSLLASINRIFSFSFTAETKLEEVQAKLDLQPTLAEFKNQVIAEATSALNGQFNQMKSELEAARAEIKELKDKLASQSESGESTSSEVKALQEEVAKLKQEKKNLEATVAELRGGDSPVGSNSNAPQTSDVLEKFEAVVNGMVEVQGESQY